MNALSLFPSGKNIKLFYFVEEVVHDNLPHAFYRRFESYLAEAMARPDFGYMMERVRYYCKKPGAPLGPDAVAVSSLRRSDCQSTYYYDVKRALSPFPAGTPINFLPGDITFVPSLPSLTKSRPIHGDNANSVLLKMDRIRHFIRTTDRTAYDDKSDIVIFRGKVPGKAKRERFFEKFWDSPLVDIGDTQRNGSPWVKPKISISEHLKYKFILSIEGNDVASNLKWVMGTNSVAVMPRPEYETWFMEGRLLPNVHYLEISRDYSDFEKKIQWHIAHPDAVKKIVANANEYCRQFYDSRRERLIEVLTVGAYLGLLPDRLMS